MTDLHRLAIVLKHANSLPPFDSREDFYALKQAILERFGERDGEDIQYIKKPCWSCTDGWWICCDDGRKEKCYRCDGTAIHSEKWIVLERWKLAGLVFHRPSHTLAGSLVVPNIEGRIKHRESKMAFAAWRVLAMLFRPQFYLYLDLFKMDTRQLKRFKAVLAYLLGFPRDKWRVEALRFHEIQDTTFLAKRREVAIPF